MEAGNLIACDRAFGRHINNCPWSLNSGGLRDFSRRPAKERIYRGENEDPLTFLKLLAQSLEYDKVKLPIVSYFRSVGFGLASNDVRPIETTLPVCSACDLSPVKQTFKKCGAWSSETNAKIHDDHKRCENCETENVLIKYPVSYVYYRISYRVVVVSHSKSALHEVALPLHYYLSRGRTFNVFYLFQPEVSKELPERMPEELNDWEAPELEFSLPATLLNPWGTDFENETAKLENITQIHVAAAEYQIKAPALFMDEVRDREKEIEFMDLDIF